MKVDFDAAAAEGCGRQLRFCQGLGEFAETTLASPGGVAERSESFKIMIASGNHTLIQ